MKRISHVLLLIACLQLSLPLVSWAVITATANKCSAVNTGSAGTIACTMPGNTTTGNFIVACVSAASNTEAHWTGVSDGTNSFTGRAGTFIVNDPGANAIKMFDVANITGLTTPTVTASFSPNQTFRAIIAQEFTDIAKNNALDQTKVNAQDATGTGTDAATTGTTASPRTQAAEVLVGCVQLTSVGTAAITQGTGFTEIAEHAAGFGMEMEYRVMSTSGTQGATWTLSGSDNIAAALATYKAFIVRGGGGPLMFP